MIDQNATYPAAAATALETRDWRRLARGGKRCSRGKRSYKVRGRREGRGRRRCDLARGCLHILIRNRGEPIEGRGIGIFLSCRTAALIGMLLLMELTLASKFRLPDLTLGVSCERC